MMCRLTRPSPIAYSLRHAIHLLLTQMQSIHASLFVTIRLILHYIVVS